MRNAILLAVFLSACCNERSAPEVCRDIAFAVEAQCNVPGWSYLDTVGRLDGTCNSAVAYDERAYDTCVDMLVTVQNDACSSKMLEACSVVITEWDHE